MGHAEIPATSRGLLTFKSNDDPGELDRLVRNYFGAMLFRPLDNTKGHFFARRVGGSVLSDVLAVPGETERDKRHLNEDDRKAWKLQYVTHGTVAVEQAGRLIVLGPGEMGLYDMDQEYILYVPGQARIAIVSLPKAAFPLPPVATRLLSPRRLAPAAGATGALAALLHTFAADLPFFSQDSLYSVNGAIVGLLSAAIREGLGDISMPLTGRGNEETVAAVKEFIQRHIANPSLDPTLIARVFHISVRQLHRLFEEEEETVGQEIRAQRIQRCAEDLRNPGHHREKISDIAARWGIADASKFSRQFRSIYGVSPRDYRAEPTP
ncbi:helix-turn-helix domain-containing protein [Streptomyces scopuliridis]|uniref:helix-turn-helix domain-containing protein n=1 Tax=Streptomyces scopuliridis TaxID=452529 RepID=UPI0035D670E9